MADIKIDPSHIVRGPWPDAPIPDTDIYSFMFHRKEVGNYPPARDPDRTAFIDGPTGKSITFRQIRDRVELLSRALPTGMNINKGDIVCFYMPNHVLSESISRLLSDRLSHRALGCSSAWCSSVLRKSNLHRNRTCPSTEIVKIEIHSNSPCISQIGIGRSQYGRNAQDEHLPYRERPESAFCQCSRSYPTRSEIARDCSTQTCTW